MMLFPKPRIIEFSDGSLPFPAASAEGDLLSFFQNLKAGMEGVRLIRSVMAYKEEYHLRVDQTGIELRFSCDEGLFRAATSLRQMIRRSRGRLPALLIRKPA